MMEMKTTNPHATKKIAVAVARKIVKDRNRKTAVIIALAGNLGSGKTTFVQGFARALGIKENVLSPTFVLLKIYGLSQKSKVKSQKFKHLIHIDCYRIDSLKDLLHLGFKKLLQDQDAIILIEWADRIRRLIPKTAVWIKFQHGKKPHERILCIKNETSYFN